MKTSQGNLNGFVEIVLMFTFECSFMKTNSAT